MDDIEAMKRCIELAREALELGDHPFGSVLVRDGAIFAEGRNQVNSKMDPTAHAESEAIREACRALETLDLSGTTIYASGEPCWMCASVIRQVKIARVVIGGLARRPTGGYSSEHKLLLLEIPGALTPAPEVVAEVLGAECGQLLDEAGWSAPSDPA